MVAPAFATLSCVYLSKALVIHKGKVWNMRFIQKLEIGVGVTTSLAVFVDFCMFAGFVLNRESKSSEANSFAIILLVIWVCSLMIAVGNYYNAVKQNNIALIAVFVGAIIVMVVLGFWGFVVSMFNGILVGVFFFVPVILSGISIILAISSRLEAKSLRTRAD